MDDQLFTFEDIDPATLVIHNRYIEPERKTAAQQARDREQLKTMARSSDPITSYNAAQNALKNVKGHKAIVLAAFKVRGEYGFTHEELGEAVPIRSDTARKRCRDLVDLGLVEDSGLKRVVSSGNQSIVWQITELGKTI